jgi:hypothetical protein
VWTANIDGILAEATRPGPVEGHRVTAAVFPDATKTVIDYLDSASSAGIQVAGGSRTRGPTEFVRVERLGGPRETRVTDAANVRGRSVGRRPTTTPLELLNAARAHLFDVEGSCSGSTSTAARPAPDPTTNMSRYTASFTIRIRAIP